MNHIQATDTRPESQNDDNDNGFVIVDNDDDYYQ